MSGFSPEWLTLREPADHAAVNHDLRRKLVKHLKDRDELTIVDLGSGAGSNLRGLAPDLPAARQHWHLVDHDAGLLRIAAEKLPSDAGLSIDVTTHQADLSAGDIARLIEDADLVTAAALFDLISFEVIETMVEQIAASRHPFYTVLTYDGIAAWMPAHAANQTMRDRFNGHQCTDKGFGPAAGPNATSGLAEAFSNRGYDVSRGASPWVLKADQQSLRHEVDRGWAAAVRETEGADQTLVDDWLRGRLAAADAVTIVGHEDLLALPTA